MRVSDGAARRTKPTCSKALKTQNQADDVACERPHRNHDGLHLVVLFDVSRLTPGGLRMTAEARMRRSDVAVGVRDRAWRRHSRGAFSVALRELHCVGHLARSGVIKAQNPADDVAYEGCRRSHRGRLLVVFFDVRRTPSSCLRAATAARMRRSDFEGGVRLRFVVDTAVWCSRFISWSCTASCTRCIPRRVESDGPGVKDGGQDKGEAPYLNYRLERRRDSRPL
jgi:hypothetical protein